MEVRGQRHISGRFNPGWGGGGGGGYGTHQIGGLASPRAVQRFGEEKRFLVLAGIDIDLQNGKTVPEINGNNVWIW